MSFEQRLEEVYSMLDTGEDNDKLETETEKVSETEVVEKPTTETITLDIKEVEERKEKPIEVAELPPVETSTVG